VYLQEHYTTKQHGFPILHSSAKHAWFDFNAQRVESQLRGTIFLRPADKPTGQTFHAIQPFNTKHFSNNGFSPARWAQPPAIKKLEPPNSKPEGRATKACCVFFGDCVAAPSRSQTSCVPLNARTSTYFFFQDAVHHAETTKFPRSGAKPRLPRIYTGADPAQVCTS
jgi:hypothetical protein